MATLFILDEVVQDLNQDRNLLRIKKLLIYATSNAWETSESKIHQYPLPELIQTLLHIAPTLEHLKLHLTKTVKTLSKQAEYTLIANAIANYFQRLYADATMPIRALSSSYPAIAQTLDQHPERIRIKKLLFCACTHTWENDQSRLDSISLLNLIKELHQLATTQGHLQAALDSIVKTLNRQTYYAQIAQSILDAFAPLYGDRPEETRVVVNGAEPVQEPPRVRSLPSPPPPPASAQPAASPPPKKVKPNLSDLFDLRFEMVKYANPLRIKLLIFSALNYPLSLQDESWTVLKGHELDDLIRELFREYRTSAALEAQLKSTAKSLPEAREYGAVVEAIARAMKGLYGDSGDRSFVEAVKAAPRTAENPNQVSLEPDSQGDENTCQVFSK
jgi:hypothetical protein